MGKEEDRSSPSAVKFLMGYDWPGNVRELENIIERALVIGKSDEITPDDLPFSRTRAEPENMPESLKMVEKMHIKKMLDKNDWNISKAARIMDIDRQTLYNKIEKYEIKRG